MSQAMIEHSIGPENTRVQKLIKDGKTTYHLLQVSAETGVPADGLHKLANDIFIVRGDHSTEMSKICSYLTRANEYVSNSRQTQFLEL